MRMCEDAPCCGCCGYEVQMAELRAEEEYREARYWGLAGDEDEEE